MLVTFFRFWFHDMVLATPERMTFRPGFAFARPTATLKFD